MNFDVPLMPLPPAPTPSLNDLIESGHSVLGELGLISWWKPSSYFRLALEGIHINADIPWWLTIVSGRFGEYISRQAIPFFLATVVLRLALIAVPIMSQRLVAKQSKYKKELDEFR